MGGASPCFFYAVNIICDVPCVRGSRLEAGEECASSSSILLFSQREPTSVWAEAALWLGPHRPVGQVTELERVMQGVDQPLSSPLLPWA